MGTKVILHPKQDGTVKRDFVAFGTALRRESRWVKGVLTKSTGNLIVSEGATLRQPPHWAILFENVAESAEGETYWLEVEDQDKEKDTQKGIKVSRTGVQVKGAFYQVSVTYPAQDEDVPNDFVAHGTTNVGGTVTGTMTKTPAEPISGTTILEPTGRATWAIQFTNVPDGTDYVLDVVHSGGDTAQVTLIDVD